MDHLIRNHGSAPNFTMQGNIANPKFRTDTEPLTAPGKSFVFDQRRNSHWRTWWLTTAVVCLVGWMASAADGSWPMFQGNAAHTGYVPVRLAPTNFVLRWQKTIDAGVALNPVTEGEGKVFVTEYGYFSKVGLHVLSQTNGDALWSVDYSGVFSLNPPSYGYGDVYIENGNGISTYSAGVTAYQADTGTAVFRSPISAQWERYLAPTLYDGNVYVDGGEYGGMYSFNATNGMQNWFGYVAQYDGWTPAVDTNYCYVFTGSGDTVPILGEFRIMDRFTGTTVHLVIDNDFQWNGYTMNSAVVLGTNNDAFAINEPGSVYPNYGASGRLLMFDLRSDATNQPHIGWVLKNHFTGQPTLGNGVLYVNDGGSLVALDELTGSRLWAWVPSPLESVTGTIIATDNLLFVGTGAATYAIDLTSHLAIWSYPAAGDLSFGDGVLYVAGANGTLTAISAQPISIDLFSKPGGPYRAECQGALTAVQLDGSGSGNAAGKPLTFYWSSDTAAATFSDPSSPTPILTIDTTAAAGCTVTLAVSDGQQTNSAQAVITVVDTKAPTIQCGPNKVFELGSAWSFDLPIASDACSGTNVAITVINTVTNNDGCAFNITRTWQATDDSGNTSLGSQTVTLTDTQLLDLSSLTASPSVLRPSNNQLVPVTIVGTVTNACGAVAECWIASVTDNQRIGGRPNAHTLDYKITGPRTLLLRAKRGGRGHLTYVITMAAKDACGNTGTCTIPVMVVGSR